MQTLRSTINPEYHQSQEDPVTGAIPLTADSSARLLNELLDYANQSALIFDLDSTLLDNRPRNAVIMREFGELNNEPILSNASAKHFQDWSPRNAMAAIGLPDSSIDHLVRPYQSFWSERFFTSEYCQYDIGIAGAAEFVTAVNDHSGMVFYLTGRHEVMRAGTQSSLQNLGFPTPESKGITLLMKPNEDQSDDSFKVDTLKKLDMPGSVNAAFDNEPTHINSYRTAFPNAVCVHLMTDHSMRPVRLLSGIMSIRNFLR